MSMRDPIFIPELLCGIDESLLAECDEMVAANAISLERKRKTSFRVVLIAAILSTLMVLSAAFVVMLKKGFFDEFGRLFSSETSDDGESFFVIEKGVLVAYTGNEKDVVIPEGVIKILAGVFQNNAYIRTLTLSSTVVEIEDGALSSCENLEEVRVAEGGAIREVDGMIFSANGKGVIYLNETALPENLVIPEGVLLVDDGLFNNNGKIKSVTLPSTMYRIGREAFSNCKSLTEVSFGGTRIIDENAFSGCSNLSKIDFGMVEEIGKQAFLDCGALVEVSFENLVKIGERAFKNTGIKSADLGKCAEIVEIKAFENTCLEEIVIPVTIKYISYEVFTSNNIKCIYFRGSKAQWDIVKRILMSIDIIEQYEIIFLNESPKLEGTVEIGFKSNKDGTCIAYALDKKNAVGKLTVPDRSPAGDTVVGIEAFENCSFITEVTLPSTVTSLPKSAFSNCVNLTAIKMPGVISIGSGAFCNCVSLEAVTLNKGISVIEQNTFAGCCYLTSITIPEGVKAIRMGAFSGCPIKEMVMPSTLEWIEANIFGHYARYSEKPCYLEKLDLSKTKLTELPANAFSREKALRTVLLPDTLDSICSLAFEECTALETVNIPDSVIYIHPRAFYGCTSLKTTIPERNESF